MHFLHVSTSLVFSGSSESLYMKIKLSLNQMVAHFLIIVGHVHIPHNKLYQSNVIT